MADDADLAQETLERLESMRGPRQPFVLAPGTAGDCTGCGEHSPRLVGGKCAPCREPRRGAAPRVVNGGW